MGVLPVNTRQIPNLLLVDDPARPFVDEIDSSWRVQISGEGLAYVVD